MFSLLVTNRASEYLQVVAADKNNIAAMFKDLVATMNVNAHRAAGELLAAFGPFLDIVGPAEQFLESFGKLGELPPKVKANLLIFAARSHFQSGNWKGAQQCALDALTKAPAPSLIRLAALTEAGRYHALLLSLAESKGHFTEALEVAKSAASITPPIPAPIAVYFSCLSHIGLSRVFDRVSPTEAIDHIQMAEEHAARRQFILLPRHQIGEPPRQGLEPATFSLTGSRRINAATFRDIFRNEKHLRDSR